MFVKVDCILLLLEFYCEIGSKVPALVSGKDVIFYSFCSFITINISFCLF